MPSSAAHLIDHLASTTRALAGCDLSTTSRNELRGLLRSVRALQAASDGFVQALATAQAHCDEATDAATFLLDGGEHVSGRHARREARRHRFVTQHRDADLERLPGEALDHLERAVRRLGGDERDRFVERLPRLADQASRLPIDVFAAQVKSAERSSRIDHGDDELRHQIAASEMKRWTDADSGMAHTLLVLDPVRDAEIHAAIGKKLRQLRHDTDGTRSVAPVDAAVALLCDRRSPGPARAGVGIIVDAQTIESGHHADTTCEFDSGTPVPPTVLDRFLCDPVITLLGTDRADQVLKAIAARTASDLQRRALRAMHPTCAHPGCDVTFDNCQIHHLVHWRHGGPTELANLVPLCSTHHHDVHDRGWDYELLPDRRLEPIPPRRSRRRRDSGRTAPTADTSPPRTRPRTASRPAQPAAPSPKGRRGISVGTTERSSSGAEPPPRLR